MRVLLASFAAALWLATPATSQEAAFLEGLSGTWSGSGEARRTADGSPIGINCRIESNSDQSSFQFSGNCRALAVIRQSLSADIRNTGGMNYQGIYVGPQGGQSQLSGARSGNLINFEVAWAEPVNGDSQARMQLETPDVNTMIIRTIDTSPTTGAEVVTSEVRMTRQ